MFVAGKIRRKTYVDTFWTGCTDIGQLCKVFGVVLNSLKNEMRLRLE